MTPSPPDQSSYDGKPPAPVSPEAAHTGLIAVDAISQLLTASAFDLDKLLHEIVRITTLKMRVKASAIRLVDPADDVLILRAVHGLSDRFLAEGPVFDTQSRFNQLIENGGVFEIYDVGQEPDLHFSRAALQEGICSLLAVGLYRDDTIIGSLSVYTEVPHVFSEQEHRTLRVIANQAAVAFQLAELHQAQLEAEWLKRELELASDLQRRVLPKTMPVIPACRIAAQSVPWEQVGGDFFDFIDLPENNLGIAVGDVSGKGVTAALLMFTVRMALRSHVEHEYAMSEIMRRVNRALQRDTQPDQFATLFYGVLNLPSRVLTYVNASHDPPLLFRGDEVFTLETGGLPVGMLAGQRYEEDAVRLQPGDLLVFYTDGYTETTGPDNALFGVDGLVASIRRHRHLAPEVIIERLQGDLDAFSVDAHHGDDRTIVVMSFEERLSGAIERF